MAIKKAKANHHNGTGFDTLHYQTEASQVKVMSGGAVSTDLETLLLKGVLKSGVDIASILGAGTYRIKNMIGEKPFNMTADVEYPLIVSVAGDTVIQTVARPSRGDFYARMIKDGAVGQFFTYGVSNENSLLSIKADIGSLSQLDTTEKFMIVDAINELVADISSAEMRLDSLETAMAQQQFQSDTHDHDERYLGSNGGRLGGTLILAKGKLIQIEDNANNPIDAVSIDASNRLNVGVATNQTVINSSGGLLQVWDGASMEKVMTNGNGGHGSGFDADKVDGIEGSDLVRKSASNVLKSDLTVSEGKSMSLQASSGSSQAGSMLFKDGSGATKAKVKADVSGDILISAGNYDNFKVKASGDTETYHSHTLLSTNRNVAVLFKDNAQDAGAGMYMNYDGRFGIWDWERSEEYVFFDRDTGRAKFKHALEVQGKRLSIQSSAPSSPSTGDVWVQI